MIRILQYYLIFIIKKKELNIVLVFDLFKIYIYIAELIKIKIQIQWKYKRHKIKNQKKQVKTATIACKNSD